MLRKLKLFPKLFITTLSVLLALVCVAHLSLYFIFPHYYLHERQQELSYKADQLAASLAEVDAEDVRAALQVYAQNENITAFLKPEDSDTTLALGQELTIDPSSSQNSVIIEDREIVTRDQQFMQIQVVSTTEMVSQATQVTLRTLPLSLAASLLAAILFSYLYAKRMSRPLMRMSQMTERMKNLDRTAYFTIESQDEIGQMESQVNELYERLLSVIDELAAQNQRMMELEKLKVDFLRSTSHELKTPLAGLRIMLENMRWKVGKYADHDYYLDQAMGKVDQLSSLVREILELSKIQEWQDQTQVIDLAHIIAEVNDDYSLLAQDRDLTIHCHLDQASLEMSEPAFRKVWANLMSNAIRYSTEAGEIQIYSQNHQLYLDNPCQPMTEEAIAKAYELFFHEGTPDEEVSSQQQGNGLGLYMVHHLLANYGVDHSFEATDTGMRFRIQLRHDAATE